MVTSTAESSLRLPAAERRAMIEEAAAGLFAERGYTATTVEDIVAAAGVSKPMLYRHFESKKQLCMKLLEHRRDELASAPLDVFMDSRGTPEQRLPPMLDAWFARVAEHPNTSRMLFVEIDGDREIRALQADLRARQRAADVALMRELVPGVDEEEIEPLGEVIRSSLSGLALWWFENPQTPRGAVVGAMLRLTLGVLAALRESAAGAAPPA